MIVSVEAVVLKTLKYRDTSRIATLYTDRYGKISVIAKGARDRKSKFGSSLQPMSHVQAVLYKKEHKELHLLSQCEVLQPFRHLTEDMQRMSAAMAVIELVHAVTHGEEENRPLFALLTKTLSAINSATKSGQGALYFFEMRLLGILGFGLNFHRCVKCENSLAESGTSDVGLQLHRGGGVCKACMSETVVQGEITLATLRVLQRLQGIAEVESATRLILSRQLSADVGSTLRRYLQHHIEGLRNLKSEAVFSAMM